MTPTQRTILWVYAAIVAIWPIRQLVLELIIRNLDILSDRSPRYAAPEPPLVTAIIPAKDEEAALADCLASVCAQTYPNLEILVVDDRSTDGTGAIARRFAADDPRVRVLTITELPDGWTGKTHALQVASDSARGEWFWFLDADTRHEPDNLSIVLEYAREHRAEMASLLPEMRCETFWEDVVQPLAGVVLMQSFPLFRVNDDRSRLAFANGQYILIRRSAYDAAGGHARSATGSSRTSTWPGASRRSACRSGSPSPRGSARRGCTRRWGAWSAAGAASSTTPWAAIPGGSWAGCSTP